MGSPAGNSFLEGASVCCPLLCFSVLLLAQSYPLSLQRHLVGPGALAVRAPSTPKIGYRTARYLCWEGRCHGLEFPGLPLLCSPPPKAILWPTCPPPPAFLAFLSHSELMRQKEDLCLDLSAGKTHSSSGT